MAEIFGNAYDTLFFDEIAAVKSPLYASATNTLTFSEFYYSEDFTFHPYLYDTLTFIHNVTNNQHIESAHNTLWLNDRANKVVQLLVHDYLSFEEYGRRVKLADAYQHLDLIQVAGSRPTNQVLTFNEDIDYHLGLYGVQLLEFVESATYNIVKICIVAENLIFESASIGYIRHPKYILNIIDQPPIGYAGTIFTFNTLTLTLPAPEFDDSNSIDMTRINRKSRGGDLQIYRWPLWPQAETLLMRWEKLKSSELNDLLIFLKNTLGQVIQLTTHEGRIFNGIISDPGGDGSQITRSRYGASLTFHVVN